jgi:DNA-binding transcriptional LysR family regulator
MDDPKGILDCSLRICLSYYLKQIKALTLSEVTMRNALDLNDLRLLSYVVDCGGFSAASKVLAMPTSTISQRIASLERAAGMGLLRRTTRSLSLTDAGKLMVPHARAIEEHVRNLQQSLQCLTGELRGAIRIVSSSEIVQFALAPVLARFAERYPDIAIQIDATNRRVDFVADGYDVEIREHRSSLKDSTLLQRVVARTSWALAAAPAYLQAHVAPSEPSDLAKRSILYFGDPNEEHVWDLQRGDCAVKVELRPSICCNDMGALSVAAVNGAGIVSLPTYIIQSSLQRGQLVPVLPEWKPVGSCISVITPPRRQSSRLIKCFTDFVASELPSMTDCFGGAANITSKGD